MASSESGRISSLADQVRDLTEGVQGELNRLHDYYEHTKAAWQLVGELADEGRRLDIDNSFTGTSIPLSELALRCVVYIEGELVESVFERLVSLLEHWVFGLLRLWLLAHPEGIPEKDKKPVKLSEILSANNKEEIIRSVVEWELLGVAYKRPSEWFKYLRARVHLTHPSDDQIEEIAEIKATRDLLIHNQGVVNASYLEKSGNRARYQLGQRVEIPEPYFHRSWELIRDLIDNMANQAIQKSGR